MPAKPGVKKPLQFDASLPHEVKSSRFTLSAESIEFQITVEGVECKLLNLSETGIAVRSPKLLCSVGQTVHLRIGINEHQIIFDGAIVVAWQREETEGYTVGARFASQLLSESLPQALELTGRLYTEVDLVRKVTENLNSDYKAFLLDFRVFLKSLRTRLDELEKRLRTSSMETRRSYERAIELWVAPHAIHQIKKYNLKLDSILPQFKTKEERAQAIELFRSELNEYLIISPFTERALEKPRGYPGDYETLNQIYRDEYEGSSLYAQIIHKYSISEASSQSVRYRKDFMIENFYELLRVNPGNVGIASLASGPAREVYEFLKTADPATIERCQFFLLDQDPEALLTSKRNNYQVLLERGLAVKLVYATISVKDLLFKASSLSQIENIKFDLLYATGLYDYLNQSVARALTQELITYLKPEGRLIIGNFHPDNPTKAISEFSVDWQLIHRTEEMMRDLVPPGFEKLATIHKDPLQIELFLEIKRNKT